MKGFALLLWAVALVQAGRPQLSLSGRVCDCNTPEVVAACARDHSDNELFAHENCNQFYKCSNGQAIPYFCSSGLLYDPVTQICNWPSNVNCGSRPIVDENEVDCSNEVDDNDDSSDSGSGPDVGTCNCNPGEAPKICAASDSDGVLVAHEQCNKFYKCENGVNVALSCPSGLLYNPYTEQCDWAHNVECKDRPVIETEEDGNNEGEDDCSEENHNGNGDNGPCNCNPGEAPSICANGGSDGILVAHENCNQFYKCANGLPVTMSCPLGLLYNPFISVCDWPHNVECGGKPIEIDGGHNGDSSDNTDSGSGGSNGSPGTCNCNPGAAPSICETDGSDGILIAHENCHQFYKCADSVPITINCPTGLLYNPYTECCDWPSNVECDRPIVEVDGENGGHGNGNGNGNGESGNGHGDNGTGGGTCNCKPEEAPGICAAETSDGILIAHEQCNKFYKCLSGKPVAIACPGELLYNPYIERCDWPENVDCATNIKPDGGDNESNGNGENESGSGGTCNCNPGQAPGICSAPGSDGVLIAHEKCNKLYKCAEGVPVTLKCPGDLLYNPYAQLCDWPHNVDCGDRDVVEEVDNGGSHNGGDGHGNGDNGSTCNCNPGEAPAICANENSDGVLIAHEKCNKFQKCSFGIPVTIACPRNLLYNPHLEVCDWPENVECGDRPVPEIDNGGNGGDNGQDGGNGNNHGNCNPSEAPAICAAHGSDGVLVAHENCNQFYKCSEGLPVALSCPSMLLYNPVTEQCDWPQNVDCSDRDVSGGNDSGGNGGHGDNNGNGESECESTGTCNCDPSEAPEICSAPGSDGVLIAHEKCNKLYKCSVGVPVTLKCPGNLLYNPYAQLCDWPHNVECGDRDIVEEIGNGGDGHGNGDSGNTCNCNPRDAAAICANENSNGVHIAHEKCNKFQMCSYGIPVTIACPGNLLYNPYWESCDWPENVDCGERPIPEIDNGGDGGDGGQDGDSNNNNVNTDPSEAPAICAEDGSDGVLIAHENCNQFYKCSEGYPAALSCQSMLLYNSSTEQCDWPQNVDCGDRVVFGSNYTGRNKNTRFSLNKHMEFRRRNS